MIPTPLSSPSITTNNFNNDSNSCLLTNGYVAFTKIRSDYYVFGPIPMLKPSNPQPPK